MKTGLRFDVAAERSVYNANLMSTQSDVLEARKEAAQEGERIYEQHLKSVLEPTHAGRIVLIHIPSGDYFLGDSFIELSHRLRKKYPRAGRGEVYARGVGQRAVIRAHTPRVTGESL